MQKESVKAAFGTIRAIKVSNNLYLFIKPNSEIMITTGENIMIIRIVYINILRPGNLKRESTYPAGRAHMSANNEEPNAIIRLLNKDFPIGSAPNISA
jgi:hypothetical protein